LEDTEVPYNELWLEFGDIGYEYRFCYKNHNEAVKALEVWEGTGDPPGNWIKQKGLGEDRPNPNYETNE
jgi:hypothetical protein